jgi:TolB protein
MLRFSIGILLLAIAGAALGAALLLAPWRPAPDLRAVLPGPPAQPPATPRPSPTPPPWLGSALALAVWQGAGQAIALVSVADSSDGRLLADGFDEVGGLAWSADGSALAFAARRAGNWDLYRLARSGGAPERLTEHPAYDGTPAWSPDGGGLAFTSTRDGPLDLYRLDLAGAPEPSVRRLADGTAPATEPAFSPDGAWLAYAAWREGSWRLEALSTAGGPPRAVAAAADGQDLRAPGWSPDGTRLAFLELRHGQGRLASGAWTPGAEPLSDIRTAAARATGYAWYPGGGAVAVLGRGREGRQVEVRSLPGVGGRQLSLPAGANDRLAWTDGSLPAGLPALALVATPRPGSTDPAARPGLTTLADVDVSGARINAALAEDFAALRAAVREGTGRDFLGRLSDLWRPLGFYSSASAFFSWHKTGRAFDTQMELRGPGSRRDMVLVREDGLGGGPMWRMYLRAGAQDGSVGAPLTSPGWTFAIGSDDPDWIREGGQRGGRLPEGYWVDFTALAERYGWRRIPSLTRANLDWRRDWEAIEYWHYERRDGLRWFEAARQVYDDADLLAELHPDRLRARDIPLGRLARQGFPAGWPPEG